MRPLSRFGKSKRGVIGDGSLLADSCPERRIAMGEIQHLGLVNLHRKQTWRGTDAKSSQWTSVNTAEHHSLDRPPAVGYVHMVSI